MGSSPTKSERPGGVIHTYLGYDPQRFPSPTQPPPDLVTPAFAHFLTFGEMRELTEEELARAVRLSPEQLARMGPPLEALIEMLEERKRKILAAHETERVRQLARRRFREKAAGLKPPRELRQRFREAVRDEQLFDLERLWFKTGDQRGLFARQLVLLMDHLAEKYLVDELAAKYRFTGQVPLGIRQALQVKEELETIDQLLKQLREAKKTAKIGVIDLERLGELAPPEKLQELKDLQRQMEEYLRQLAEAQGLERTADGYRLAPKAYRLFQDRLLETIFADLQPSRSGRHRGPILGEGALELPGTRSYEFGDSLAHVDVPGSLVNALVREGPGLPVPLKPQDISVHRTRCNPKCATAVLLDMSGSMRYGGQYINVKRMGLALEGLIRREYPGDFLRFLEMFTFARPRPAAQIAALMPKPVMLYDPVVRLRADMSKPEMSEAFIPQHFTNIQHALALARQLLAAQSTPNRQVILITDGLPTAHFEGELLYLLYPPDRRTEEATLREGKLLAREGITINIFLLPGWSQTEEDVRFSHRLAESTRGRVFFTGGKDLDRFVLWDYVNRRRQLLA